VGSGWRSNEFEGVGEYLYLLIEASGTICCRFHRESHHGDDEDKDEISGWCEDG
jgi:hypothetical protein